MKPLLFVLPILLLACTTDKKEYPDSFAYTDMIRKQDELLSKMRGITVISKGVMVTKVKAGYNQEVVIETPLIKIRDDKGVVYTLSDPSLSTAQVGTVLKY